ncbi:MAG: VWA domain-containing protein [Terracidiphilus sp.]
MKRPIVAMFLSLACAVRVMGQADDSATTLRVNSRAVLVDVIVSDSSGKPVTGLSRDAFSVTEQGKPQRISFFEENGNTPPARPVAMPTMPPDVFTNFSPFPQPPAVNVLLLDSLNTHMENQSYVHKQALQFLKSAKPGTRMAIFTMGLGLHFIQGFNDDPAVLMAALNNKKNNEVETAVMLKGQDETNAQQNLVGMMSTSEGNGATAASPGMIAALQNFISENDTSRSGDRMYVTLANLQRLAAFLQGFPGRKNIIWFAEKVPALYVTGSDASGGVASGTPAIGDEIKKTLAMLAAARAAIYPVDARGVSNNSLYTAENNLSHGITQSAQLLGATTIGSDYGSPKGSGGFANSMTSENIDRNSDQANAQILAEQSGGKAFANTNALSDVIDKITSTSSHFYTLSYSPTNAKMDGTLRNIEVKVEGGKYKLAYRRGYFAVEEALPGSSLTVRGQEVQKLAAKNPGAIDPLLPFMDLGMPQSEQILYKALIVPTAAGENEPADKKNKDHYKVDFAIDLKDVKLNLDTDGLHKGELNISLVVYDRYGNIISREDYLVPLNIKPDVYAMFQNTGVQLHADLAVPKGNFWLRTGIYDRASHKVGTMEIPLAAVKPLETAAK